MADAVTSQTLIDGSRNVVVKFTNISDGTGESGVVKVDPANFQDAAKFNNFRIDWIIASTFGMQVEIIWDGGTPAVAWVLGQNENGERYDFRQFGGLQNNAVTPNNKIKFTTLGATLSDSYSIMLGLSKV